MRRWILVLGLLVVLGLVVGAAYLGYSSTRARDLPAPQAPDTVAVTRGDVQQAVVAPGQLVGTQETGLSFGVAGQVARVDVRPGEVIQAGDVLAQLDLAPLQRALDTAQGKLARAEVQQQRQLKTAELDLRAAQARLEKARLNNPTLVTVAAALKSAQADFAALKAAPTADELAVAQRKLERARNSLWATQAARDETCGRTHDAACDGSKAVVLNAELEVRNAERDLDMLKAGPTEAQLAAAELALQTAQANYEARTLAQRANLLDLQMAENDVERAALALRTVQDGPDPAFQQEVRAAQEALEAAVLRAPYACTVLDVRVRPGDSVAAGSIALLLANPAAVEARTTVIEEDLGLLRVDQQVEVSFDAQPERVLRGHVSRIVPQRISGDRPLYPVYIALDEAETGLYAGMTVDASIIIAQRMDVLRLPRALVRAGAGGTALVKVWANGQSERRTIRVGLRGDVYIEILEGLRQGELVVSE